LKITKENKGDIAYLPQGTQLYELVENKKGVQYLFTKKKTQEPRKYIIVDVLHYAKNDFYVKLLIENIVYYTQTDKIFLIKDDQWL